MLLVGHSASVHIAALRTLHKAYLKAQNVPLLAIRGMSGSSSPIMTSCRRVQSGLKDILAPARDPLRTRPIHFAKGDEPALLLMTGTDGVKEAGKLN